ncbi:uncharacterized protein MEPE_00351 [Melanopsichium pennsylvanicum]|uniref:YCII-related domain-containing protein n=2 Tax=Melanopsichium pennsylvanicum TaxID=63383 RepID=A0AAJ5C2K9_9BASI|nr:conserved hypothetical protein [Melanopsichium pennsylvanicum 4]SNX81646.1 uncharacterized protein MEPE_00351 [Melanopsichium pennsylvanicum]
MSLLRTSSSTILGVRQVIRTPLTRNFASASNPSSASTTGPWSDFPNTTRLNRYLVVAQDFSDSGANARRFEVRDRHLEHAQFGKRAGRIELGGALLKTDFQNIDEQTGPGPHMIGSIFIVLGESIQDVRQRVMQDEYVQGNVWDVEKLKIYPFLQAPLVKHKHDIEMGEAEANSTSSSNNKENANATLGQLRQDLAAGKGPKIVTLGALRKMHQSVYNRFQN